MRNPYNILRHEMIGLEVEVSSIKGESYKMRGIVYDETRNMLLIKENNKIKKVPKNSIILIAKLDDGSTVEINGKLVLGRPEERIKKRYKIFFKF